MATAPQPPAGEPQPDATVLLALNAMGLDSPTLRAAIRAGHDVAIRVTSHDVRTKAGYERWAVPLRHLGDKYVPKGFRRERPGGFEVLRSPDDLFDIAVVAGSAATGIGERMPTSALPRGPLTGQAIGHNRGQMRLDSNVVPFGAREVRPDVLPDRLTWFLLHFYDEKHDELRIELSVPVEFTRIRTRGGSERVVVTRFDPRLILPPIPLDDSIRDEDEDEGDDQIDIQIPRR
jgi:hypothetical protein